MEDKEYIKELEKALIFVCDCYSKAKDSVASCREDSGQTGRLYTDLWFNFPQIQGTARFAVEKIGSLRTNLGNREENKMSMNDIFERMHIGRRTEREITEGIKETIKNNKTI